MGDQRPLHRQRGQQRPPRAAATRRCGRRAGPPAAPGAGPTAERHRAEGRGEEPEQHGALADDCVHQLLAVVLDPLGVPGPVLLAVLHHDAVAGEAGRPPSGPRARRGCPAGTARAGRRRGRRRPRAPFSAMANRVVVARLADACRRRRCPRCGSGGARARSCRPPPRRRSGSTRPSCRGPRTAERPDAATTMTVAITTRRRVCSPARGRGRRVGYFHVRSSAGNVRARARPGAARRTVYNASVARRDRRNRR